mgnify:CR=1 FL=1
MSQIEGYENYIIFEDGKVINTNNGREIKPYINGTGYKQIQLFINGKRKQPYIHRLIAKVYIPNPENKPVIDHINRDRKDNRIENLRWVSTSENGMNRSCFSNLGFQFISKNRENRYVFQIQRPELKQQYYNKDLQQVIEFRNKFCIENNIEINDIL